MALNCGDRGKKDGIQRVLTRRGMRGPSEMTVIFFHQCGDNMDMFNL